MKRVKQLLAFALTLAMAFAIALPVFAGEDAQATGTITISNSAKGETYVIYKLFGATNSVKQTNDGESVSIAYTGSIPNELSSFFVKDQTTGEITATAAAKKDNGELSDAAIAALTAWAETQTATEANTKTGTGGALSFTVPYGYYVVTTTQGDTAISVDSTNPNASIIDKNTTPAINKPTKTADDDDVFIGQTVTYTVKFGTANFNGDKQIVKYIISDDFAKNGSTEVLGNVTVTSINVIKDNNITPLTIQQFNNGTIEIPWVDKNNTNLYANGAQLEITYTAKVLSTAVVAGGGNTNKASITWVDQDGNGPDEPSSITVEETIYTYAFAIKKVDQEGKNLSGAKFQLPFYVMSNPATDGAYVYAGTTSGEGLVNELTTPENGLIIIKGVESGKYTITELEAPQGYNKLTADVEAEAIKNSAESTSTTVYLDKDGNIVDAQTTGGSTVLVQIADIAANPVVVVNKTGTELPSTGGIGTTIFYIVGGVMVAGAAIFLLTKRRMSGNVQ